MMSELQLFLLLVGLIVGGLLMLVVVHTRALKRGGIVRFKRYIRDSGAAVGVGAVTLITVLALVLISPESDADEPVYFDTASFRAGVDHSFREDSPQCEQGGANDQIASTVELKIQLVRLGRVSSSAYYQHKSCAVSADQNSYDALGVDVEVKLW